MSRKQFALWAALAVVTIPATASFAAPQPGARSAAAGKTSGGPSAVGSFAAGGPTFTTGVFVAVDALLFAAAIRKIVDDKVDRPPPRSG